MKTRLALLLVALSAAALAQRERIEYFDVRNGRLFAQIQGEDRVLSTNAIRAWRGWTPQILLYTEQVNGRQALRWYDAFTRKSQLIGIEDLNIADLTHTRLSTGDYAILIGLRDPATNFPSVALATPNRVFYRESNATYGTAANDQVEIRRFNVEDLERTKGNLDLLQPAAIVHMPLVQPPASAAGLYELTLPAADASSRSMTLNLRPDGSAAMITVFGGKGEPIARRGTWKQDGAEVRVSLEDPSETLAWTVVADGLAPKTWDRSTYGSVGLPFRKPGAPVSVPRRVPGSVR